MNWKFELDALIIEEPVGFNDINFNINRDPQWHGIIFEATTSSLKFYGEAFDYLKAAKEAYGVDAKVIFTASQKCEGEDDYTIALKGKLNFGRYVETCGSSCMISLPVEQSDCTMIFKNRFDQKINVDSQIAYDKQTVLQRYSRIGVTIPLVAQALPIVADGSVDIAGDGGVIAVSGFLCNLLIRPVYLNMRDASINVTQLDNVPNFFQDCDSTFLISPQVLIDEPGVCLPVVPPYLPVYHSWSYNLRLKGTISWDKTNPAADSHIKSAKLIFAYWGANGDILTNQTIISQTDISINMSKGTVYSFDQTYTGSIVLPDGNGVYAYILFNLGFHVSGVALDVTYNFEDETSFLFSAVKICPPTDAKVYLVNETLSRITESITNRCLTVQSDYYGRTDSQPYRSTADGCGSLRVITSGLRIRQANDKEFFASLKEILEGLKSIDNIGMGIETDRLRIEPVKYFYNETEIMTIDLVPEIQRQIIENLIYSIVKVGYKKWEIKSIKGIDEFNSTKEFRTNISSVSNTLDVTSDLIASGYIIENLRTSTLAGSGNADSTYDNDLFIICIKRLFGSQVRQVYFNIGTPGSFFYPMKDGIFLSIGDVTTVSGTVSNNGTYHITNITDDGFYYYFTTTEPTVTENNVTTTFTNVAGSTSGMLTVEQGVTENATNVFSPATLYNWRIRPLYNLMRWAKSVFPAYTNFINTANKIFFSSGTGNYLASGNLASTDDCRLENVALAENVDLSISVFDNIEDYTPVWKPEAITFDYPLSIKDYNLIKANPYGYFSVQCGNGDFMKAYIKEIQYTPVKGDANFTLLLKWQ